MTILKGLLPYLSFLLTNWMVGWSFSSWTMFLTSQQKLWVYVNSVLTDGQITSAIADSCPVDYPVRLSSGPCAVNRELKQRRQRRQRERPESNRFRLTKQQLLQVHHAFLHICLPSLLDYDVKLPNFACYGGPKHKRTIFFFFCELRYSALEFNSWKNLQHLTN